MGCFFKIGILVSALLVGVLGQDVCDLVIPNECYYTGAGTISTGNANANQYIAIGGLFDIHMSHDDDYCGADFSQEGMLNLMAFYWSVNKYGSDIKDVKVAAVAFDNCMHVDQAVENVLSFSRCKVRVQGIRPQNVVAYVGPYYNSYAETMDRLAKDQNLVLVSPSVDTMGVENSKNLLEVRPGMEVDLKALLAFLKKYDFQHVMVVYSKSAQWQAVYNKLEEMLGTDDICEVYSQGFDDATFQTDGEGLMANIAEELKKNKASKFVLPLMSKEQVKALITATSADTNLVYLLNSDIGRDTSVTTRNVIVVEPAYDPADLMEFNNFLKNNVSAYFASPDISNPWLSGYLAGGGQLPTSGRPSIVDQTLYRTIQSVEAIVQGMKETINENCAGPVLQFCSSVRNDNRNIISNEIKEKTDQLKAEEDYKYFLGFSDGTYQQIGTYKNGVINFIDFRQTYSQNIGLSFDGSSCAENNKVACCLPPTTQPPIQSSTSTAATTAAPTTESTAALVAYPMGKEITGAFSNMDRYDDDDDDDKVLRFDIDQKWIIALGVLAGLGILCVLIFEIVILYKMAGTRMGNRWRTMWLGQLLLFGILLAYLVCFAYLWIPTKATCGITRFGVGLAYAMCFAVLLVKLMVILTSKSSDGLLPGDMDSPNYLKGVYQFLMFMFAVGVQIVINVQWLITVPPEAIKVVSNSGQKVWVCNHYTWETGKDMLNMADFVRTNFENHLLSLIYIMVLIIIITVLSLRAHGIITNHRESVFIGLAAGFSIPIWLAWGLMGGLYRGKDYSQEYGDACTAFGLLITATLILFTMFLPKVRQLVNMGVEGIYLEDDRETIYGGSVIMGPPSFKSRGHPSSVIYVNNQGIYSEPVVVGNGDSSKMATHLKHPGSTYSAPPNYLKKSESTYGGSRVLRVTDDLKGRHPMQKSKPHSEIYGSSGRPRSHKGTLPRSGSSDLGAL